MTLNKIVMSALNNAFGICKVLIEKRLKEANQNKNISCFLGSELARGKECWICFLGHKSRQSLKAFPPLSCKSILFKMFSS